MGQRLAFSVITIVLLVVGALLGQASGSFPTLEDGSVLTPDSVLTLIGTFVAPITFLFLTSRKFFEAISARVVEGKIQAGSLLDLFTSKEFVLAIISVVAGVIQIFAPTFIISEETQMAVTNGIMLIITSLLGSFSNRDNRDPIPTQAQALTRAHQALTEYENDPRVG